MYADILLIEPVPEWKPSTRQKLCHYFSLSKIVYGVFITSNRYIPPNLEEAL